MLSVSNLSLQFGKRILFDEVNITFSPGNCYGIIGANGAGKSTFLKILSKDLEPNTGSVFLEPGKRLSVLEQNHNRYDDKTVIETVILGNQKLFELKSEIDSIYAKEDFSDKDADRVGELQVSFEEMNGWNADADAAFLLSNLGISEEIHNISMNDIDQKVKVKVLLAQCLFGNPDVLIMDEPTNDLDYTTVEWLVNFINEFENTVIVVSHDRFFLDTVCTHISDIDFSKINHYSGNYTFWQQSSELAARQKQQQNKKAEEKKKELQEFISRFSANVAKSKQATARKKMIEKLNIEEIKPSSRRYPAIIFEQERDAGDQILELKSLSYENDGETYFKDISFNLNKGEKVLILSKNSRSVNLFYDCISGSINPTEGSFNWGVTTSFGYLPMDNHSFFDKNISLVDWLRQWANNDEEREELFIRSFLGRMLFSGDEALKSCNVLSGGEKVRCMLSKIMMGKPNVLLIDEPTNHLDLESITAFNNSLINFKGTVLLSSNDRAFSESVSNRIIEITPNGVIDSYLPFSEYINDDKVLAARQKLYN
ncbi:MAG: ATP-binding cassette domain-containing protein [Bacteroidetes bacterium]|nr:ATP-binding cassette domain-containing protein [Bacteroidota bacterium]MDA1225755.1 ATP-binding cassette domain-containing protein [Bacteroidota bacterium]